TDDDLPAVGLVDVVVQRGRHDNDVQKRLQPFGHQGLQGVGYDRQLDAGHVGDGRAPTGRGVDDDAAVDRPAVGNDPGDAAVGPVNAGDLGGGVDLDAVPVGAAGVAPDDGVVADDAAGRVVEAGEDRLVCLVADVEPGHEAGDFVAVDQTA